MGELVSTENGNLKVRAIVLQTDTPSKSTGILYPKEVIKKAIQDYKDTNKDRMSRIGFVLESGAEVDRPKELRNATHIVEDIRILEDGGVEADITVMENTRRGRVLAGLLRSGCSFNSSIHGVGTVDKDANRVTEYSISGVDLCVRPAEKAILDHSEKLDDFEMSELKSTGKGHRRVLRIEYEKEEAGSEE